MKAIQLSTIIGCTHQVIMLSTPIYCNDTIFTAIESMKNNPGIYLRLVKKVIGGAVDIKFQNKVNDMKYLH